MPKKISSAALRKALWQSRPLLNLWLSKKRAFDELPSLAVGITHHGKLVYQGYFGWADRIRHRPVTPTTSYRIASISKTFTAIAILQLVEKKKIRLNDPMKKYLPWLRPKKLAVGNQTVGQTLSHLAGWLRDGETSHWADDHFPSSKNLRTMAKPLALLKDKRGFKYSNLGYALLGEVIATASGMSYEASIAKKILRPLHMQSTWPDLPSPMPKNLAVGYSRLFPGRERASFRHSQSRSFAPAAGFISTVPDLGKFLAGLPTPGRLLSKKSYAAMQKLRSLTGNGSEGYGYGLGLLTVNGQKIIEHSGGYAGFTTQLLLAPRHDLGVIVLSNALGSSASDVAFGIFRLLAMVANTPPALKKTVAHLRPYEGLFRSRWGDRLVMAMGNRLLAINPWDSDPTKNQAWLVPTRHRGIFTIDMANRFDMWGETARFVGSDRKQKLYWGPTPLKKIH